MADRKIHRDNDIDSGRLDWQHLKHEHGAYTLNGTPGDQAASNIFIVSGLVMVRFFSGLCNVNLVGAATIDIGIADDTDILSDTQFANASTWDVGEVWLGTSADSLSGLQHINTNRNGVKIYNANIIETIAGADITAGQVDYIIEWAALESGASVVSA